MNKLFYAFHYISGLTTTYANRPNVAAGFVRAYATADLRDLDCNSYASSFLDFNKKVLPIRAVTRKEIISLGHADSLNTYTETGAAVAAHVVGCDIDFNVNFINTTITESDYDLDYGFFWVVFNDGHNLQCCLEQRADKKGFKKAIYINDCGFDDGLCADCNAIKVDEFGRDIAINILISKARKMGIKIN